MALFPQFLTHQVGVITTTAVGTGGREGTRYYSSQAMQVPRTDSESCPGHGNIIWSHFSLVKYPVLLTRLIPFSVQGQH